MQKRKIDWTIVFLSAIVLILAFIAWRRGGVALALTGLKLGGEILLNVTPLLLAAFLIAGLAQVLVNGSARARVGAASCWPAWPERSFRGGRMCTIRSPAACWGLGPA
jgi:hypothetical protein